MTLGIVIAILIIVGIFCNDPKDDYPPDSFD